jgi:acetoin utilization deacetylase AcuC-like enzyme
MTERLIGVADRSAGGKMALLLEGGYDLVALEESLAASLRVLGGVTAAPADPGPAEPLHESEIKRTKKALESHWRVFG